MQLFPTLIAVSALMTGCVWGSPEDAEPPAPSEAADPAASSTWPADSLGVQLILDSLSSDSAYIGLPFSGSWLGRPEVQSAVPYLSSGAVVQWEFELFQAPDGIVRGVAILQSQVGTRLTHEVLGVVDSNAVVLTLSCRCLARGTVKYEGRMDSSAEIRGWYVTPGPSGNEIDMILRRQPSNLVSWPVRRPGR